jgi:hypothetical protein
MAINSKKKGNRGERKIVDILNKHFSTKEFARVPASGATSTIHTLSKGSVKSYCGDIITPDNFKFSIENKCGYDIDLYNIFKEDSGDRNQFVDFINQSKKDSEKVVGIFPMVIYTRTRKKPLIGFQKNVIPENFILYLNQYLSLTLKKESFENNKNETEDWIFADLNEVLSKFPKRFFFTGIDMD